MTPGRDVVRAQVPASNRIMPACPPEIDSLLWNGAAVAIGVSGGKDSQAAAIATVRHLDQVGHSGPRLLIHSDLGLVEWAESAPACAALAGHLGLELVTVHRKAGGLMERWEARWKSSVRRYAALETVTLVLPWSTPGMRFCTSELKTQVIIPELRRRFAGLPIVNVTGVRAEESATRARLAIADKDKKSTPSQPLWNWRPILHWKLHDVLDTISRAGQPLHRAYTEFGTTRVSCAFCIMSSLGDLRASASNPAHADLFRRMVDLEALSSFAFQGNRWLADIAPHLLSERQASAIAAAKRIATARKAAEGRIPQDLFYVKGWPVREISRSAAGLLADVRRQVSRAVGIDAAYLDADAVVRRYRELIDLRIAKDRLKKTHEAGRKAA